MRNAYFSIRLRLLAAFMLFGLAPVALAAPAHVYDKYRNVNYSNKGLMSESDEVQIGWKVHQEQVLQKFRLVEDPEIVDYVSTLGQRIAQTSERPNLQYQFFVVDDQSVNAFSIPGGFIYVNTGLLRIVESEDELAAVLAHEIAHVVARHGLRNLKSAQKAQIGVGIASILGSILTGGAGGRAIGAGAQIFAAGQLTKHSRDFEREADYLGLYNITEAGFDPNGMIGIFEKLGRNGSKSSMGGIFASHPDARERAQNTQAEISQRLGNRASGYARRPMEMGDGALSFEGMKRAVSSGRSDRYGRTQRGGRYDRRQGDGRYGNDPYGNDPYGDPRYDDRSQDQHDPGPYDPPPMRRRTARP